MYRKDLTDIIRQIEKIIQSKYLKNIYAYAYLGAVFDAIEYNIEKGDFVPEAIDALIDGAKKYMRIMHPEVIADKEIVDCIAKLSQTIRKN